MTANDDYPQCMAKPSHWAVLTLKPFETWAHKGVILLGDAVRCLQSRLAQRDFIYS